MTYPTLRHVSRRFDRDAEKTKPKTQSHSYKTIRGIDLRRSIDTRQTEGSDNAHPDLRSRLGDDRGNGIPESSDSAGTRHDHLGLHRHGRGRRRRLLSRRRCCRCREPHRQPSPSDNGFIVDGQTLVMETGPVGIGECSEMLYEMLFNMRKHASLYLPVKTRSLGVPEGLASFRSYNTHQNPVSS